jgi:hypothetical protein
MKCIYCTSSIVKDYPGYGYYLEVNANMDYIRKYWHSECMQLWEDVVIA